MRDYYARPRRLAYLLKNNTTTFLFHMRRRLELSEIELKSRILCFCYPKPTNLQVTDSMRDAGGFKARKGDVHFDKGCTKVHQNVFGRK